MASPFVLTANLQFQAPQLQRFITQVRQQLQNQLNVNVNVNTGNANSQLTNTGKATKNVAKQADTAASAMGRLGKQFKGAVFYALRTQIAYAAIRVLTRGISEGVKSAFKFERQLIKVSQVTGRSVKQLQGLQSAISTVSKELGVSSSSLIETTRILAQTGMTAADTKIAMEALAKTTLAPTFDDIKNTAETAVAAMRQFKLAASDLERVLGQINAVAGQFAVESSDIGTAIKRAGGAFRAAGGQVEELIALFTSVRSTTRETAETIATGFRTIFTRLQRPTTIKFLRQFGIELTDLSGKFVGPYEAVRRLSIALKDLDPRDLRFSAIVEQLGGFRQVSKVIPLVQQFGEAEKARAVAMAESNSLTRDSQTAQQAAIVKFQKLTETLKELFRTITASTSFQVMMDVVLGLANAATKLANSLGGLLPILGMLGVGTKLGMGMMGAFKGRRGFNKGGFVPGSGNTDTVPAMLTPGEFVIKKSSARAIGAQNLYAMNKYAYGGKAADGIPGMKFQKRVVRKGVDLEKKGSSPFSPTSQFNAQDKMFTKGHGSFAVSFVEGDDGLYSTRVRKLSGKGTTPKGVKRIKLRGKPANLSGKAFENALIQAGLMTEGAGTTGGNQRFDGKRGATFVEARSRGEASGMSTILGKAYGQALLGGINASRTTEKADKKVTLALSSVLFENQSKMTKHAEKQKKKAMAKRGRRKPFNAGGGVSGGDSVPALLTPGEFVINRKSAQSIGYGNLSRMNRHGVAKFNKGGGVGMMGGAANIAMTATFAPAMIAGLLEGLEKFITKLSGGHAVVEDLMKAFTGFGIAVASATIALMKMRTAAGARLARDPRFALMKSGKMSASQMNASQMLLKSSGSGRLREKARLTKMGISGRGQAAIKLKGGQLGFMDKLMQNAAGLSTSFIALTAIVVAVGAAIFALGKSVKDRALKDIEEAGGDRNARTSNVLGISNAETAARGGALAQKGGMMVMGAGIGAALGSIIPGVGTAVGAGVGALVGGIAGLFIDIEGDIAAAVNRGQFNAAMKSFTTSVQLFEKGIIGSATFLDRAGQALIAVQKRSSTISTKEDLQNLQKQRGEVLKQTSVALDKFIKDIKTTDPQAAISQLMARGGAQIEAMAKLQGLPVEQIVKQYKEQAKAVATSNKRMAEMAKVFSMISRLKIGINAAAGAIERYNQSLARSQTAFDNLVSTTSNASMKMGEFVALDIKSRANMGQGGNISAGLNAAFGTNGLAGGTMAGMASAGGAAAMMSDFLATNLQGMVAEAGAMGGDLTDNIRKLLVEQFGGAAAVAADPALQAQVDSVVAKLGGMANEADGAGNSLASMIDKDLEGTLGKIVGDLPGKMAIDVLNMVNKALHDQTKQFAKLLAERTKLEGIYTKALQRVVDVQVDNAKILADLNGEITSPQQSQADFERRNNVALRNSRVAGGAGNLASVGEAAFANQAERQEIANRLKELADVQSQQGGSLTKEQIKERNNLLNQSEQLRDEFNNLTGVLESYAASTERLKVLQDNFAKAQKQREAKASKVEDILIGSNESANKAARTMLATAQATAQGNLSGLTNEEKRDTVGFLRAQGRNKEAEKLLVEEFKTRFAGQAPPEQIEAMAKGFFEASKTEKDVLVEIRDVLKEREEAAKILAELQGRNLDQLNSVIANQNETFLLRLEGIMLQATKQQNEAEQKRAQAAKSAAEAEAQNAEKLRQEMSNVLGRNITSDQFDKLNTQAGRDFIDFARSGKVGAAQNIRDRLRGGGDLLNVNYLEKVLDPTMSFMEDLEGFFTGDQNVELGRENQGAINAFREAAEAQIKQITGGGQAGAMALKAFQENFEARLADGGLTINNLQTAMQNALASTAQAIESEQETFDPIGAAVFGSPEAAAQVMANIAAIDAESVNRLNEAFAKVPEGKKMEDFATALTNATNQYNDASKNLIEINKKLAEQKEAMATAETNATNNAPQRPSVNESVGSFYRGGTVYASTGAFIPRGTDTVPAMLTPGEFVVRKAAVDAIGIGTLRAINNAGRAGIKRRGGNGYYHDGDTVSGGGGVMIDASRFDKSIQAFSVQIGRLSDVLKGGFSVDVGGTINVDVHLNGAEWLSEAEGAIGEIAAGKVRQGINSMLKKHFPKLGRDPEVIGKSRSKTIETNIQT